MFIRLRAAALLTVLGALGVAACGGRAAAELDSIGVSSTATSLAVGTTVQLKATGHYSDGSTSDISNGVSWTTSSASLARVSGSGAVSAVGVGTATVSATLDGVVGRLTLKIELPAPALSILAGSPTTAGDRDGTGGAASFSGPQGIATDTRGNVSVADTGNGAIRVITPAGVVNTVSTLPDTGDFHATDSYNEVAVDGDNFVYSVEQQSYIGPAGPEFSYLRSTLHSSAGLSKTLAYCDGTIYMSASCSLVSGIVVDPTGNIYFIRDQTVNKLTPQGVVTTVAGTTGVYGSADGTGSTASFTYPWDIAIDTEGNLYVTDGNNTVRKITPTGVVSTLAGTANVTGSADGTGAAAEFNFNMLNGIVVDGAGNAYVADPGNDTLRKITPAGVVTTIAGRSGSAGFMPGALPGELSKPVAVAIFGTTLYATCDNAIVQITNVP